jgi:hypothetical protein
MDLRDPFRISLSRTAPHYKSSNSTTCKRLNSYATRSEQPLHPEITIDSISQTSQENARVILDHLIREGFVLVDEAQSSTADAPITSILRKEPLSDPKD